MELIMLVGIPASGKSTLCEKYRRQGYRIVSSDEIRGEMLRETSLRELSEGERSRINSRVFERVNAQVAASLKHGQSVVMDATNLNRKRRIAFLNCFKRFDCRRKCVLLVAPVEVCMERNRRRSEKARVPDADMYRMLCSFVCPNTWEGWDEIEICACSQPYAFPFEAIRDFPQDNPHHSLTLDKHLEAAARWCRKNGMGRQLERVARYHDIGKLYTKRFENRKGEPTVHAHYLGHENYGAYLYLAEMCCGKELSRQDFDRILYETNLINCHMRPLVCWSDSNELRERDRELFGEAFFNDLLALNRADREAHSED